MPYVLAGWGVGWGGDLYEPDSTLMAPCTESGWPLVKPCIRSGNSSGHCSGQSQCAIADTAYATLDRTLLMDSDSPTGKICLIFALACCENA